MDICVLKESDINDRKTQWPVLFAFDDDNPSFVERAQSYARGKGVYNDDVCTSFWNELDEYEQSINQPFDVSCTFCSERYDMTHQEFYGFFELACRRYLETHPDTADVLEKALSAYREKFLP